mgnify:CR=1 FL=1
MANNIRDLPNEEPPSKGDKDSFKLCISSSWDIHSVIFGCQPLLAGCNCFRSLVALGRDRRGSVLAANKEDKING